MLASPRARLTVVQPHAPDDPIIPGLTATTRLTAAETGSISIVEHVFAPGVSDRGDLVSRGDLVTQLRERVS